MSAERARPSAMRRVLVVTDLGPAGAEAVRVGAARASDADVKLAVVHTMPSLDMVRPLWTNLVADDALRQAQLPEHVRAMLARHVAEASGGAEAELFLEVGGVADQALEVAERWDADLIITGAPDDGTIDAQRIVRHAHVPVLIARPGPTGGPVIACTDFSDPSLPAIAAAAAEARRTGARLHVLHVLEPIPVALVGVEGLGIVPTGDWLQTRRDAAERQLARAIAIAGVDGDYAAVEGGVVRTLVAAATERAASLLVVGTVGRTGVTRFLLGSVAEDMIQRATCPTLVVRLHRGGK